MFIIIENSVGLRRA